jgi:hypothetical protein
MTPTKSIFKSKTFAVNFLIACVTYLVPQFQSVVQAHPNECLLALTVINGLLRTVTHEKVSLFGTDQ